MNLTKLILIKCNVYGVKFCRRRNERKLEGGKEETKKIIYLFTFLKKTQS
jgi:hypothetical protein